MEPPPALRLRRYIPAFGRGPRTGWLAESAPQLIAPKGGIAVNDFLQV